jgi:aldehyde:ferredoxin oxidoreductase
MKEPYEVAPEYGGPEYETLWAFGPDCGVSNLTAIARANYLCNQLGLDTISTGSTIACAMELSALGHIREEIRFGDAEAVVDLVRLIGYREGIGADLAEGVRHLSEKYGGAEFAPHVKGLELPAYEPRAAVGHGLGVRHREQGRVPPRRRVHGDHGGVGAGETQPVSHPFQAVLHRAPVQFSRRNRRGR